MVTLAQFHQHCSEQWTLSQIEWRARRFPGNSHRHSLTFGFWGIPQVYEGQSEAGFSGMNDLHRLAIMHFESGSPDFMAPDNFSEGPFQRDHIQRFSAANGQRFVVNRNFRWNYLAVKPNLLLGQRQRRHASSRPRTDVSLGLRCAPRVSTQALFEQAPLGV